MTITLLAEVLCASFEQMHTGDTYVNLNVTWDPKRYVSSSRIAVPVRLGEENRFELGKKYALALVELEKDV